MVAFFVLLAARERELQLPCLRIGKARTVRLAYCFLAGFRSLAEQEERGVGGQPSSCGVVERYLPLRVHPAKEKLRILRGIAGKGMITGDTIEGRNAGRGQTSHSVGHSKTSKSQILRQQQQLHQLQRRRRKEAFLATTSGQELAAYKADPRQQQDPVSQDGKPLGDPVFPPFTNLDMGEGVTAAPIIVPSRTDEGTSYIHQQLNRTNTATHPPYYEFAHYS
ncbi:unnamed protein product [Prunus armeniaca]|uniref:Uncharacterized protein n=1 Tax=Prunus armeniaca TaxID=36596 RepID=A0A6J5W1S1_PRUAR|nr:unnamed protein product [Prunus armeniaca]